LDRRGTGYCNCQTRENRQQTFKNVDTRRVDDKTTITLTNFNQFEQGLEFFTYSNVLSHLN